MSSISVQATIVPCAGDPSRNVGDTWLCDDGCNRCHCGLDGTITAAGCKQEQLALGGGDAARDSEANLEAVLVQGAFFVVVACFVLCCGVLLFMTLCGRQKGWQSDAVAGASDADPDVEALEPSLGSGSRKPARPRQGGKPVPSSLMPKPKSPKRGGRR